LFDYLISANIPDSKEATMEIMAFLGFGLESLKDSFVALGIIQFVTSLTEEDGIVFRKHLFLEGLMVGTTAAFTCYCVFACYIVLTATKLEGISRPMGVIIFLLPIACAVITIDWFVHRQHS